MKNFSISVALILLAVLIITALPIGTDFFNHKVVTKLPVNNSSVAGIQKFISPPISQKNLPPAISAKSILVLDLGTDTTLLADQENVRLPIASTTKIMTALVASEYFKLDSVLTVNDGANIIGSKIGLTKGESMDFRSLLYGLLLNSGNDAAFTIAENYPGSTVGFVSAMNKKASLMGLKNTHFHNPAGLDHPDHYSSANDLAEITKEALKNMELARIFATKDTEVTSIDKKYTYQLHNLNKLLSSVAGVLGVKTGYTAEAKENLVTLVNRNDHRILIIVLGSNDRFGESTKLIDWTYSNFIWVN